MKNILCNLVEDMLNNWSDTRDSVLAIKTKIVDNDAQLTTMDKSFAWKDNASISGHAGLSGGGCDRGGGGSGSAIGGMVLVSRGGGGSGSMTWCTTTTPHAPPFPIPSTIEPLFKCLKEMSSQKRKQQQQPAQPAQEAATNSPTQSQEE